MEARWFNVIQTVLLQDSEIGTLALRDSTALIGANLRILQIFIQVKRCSEFNAELHQILIKHFFASLVSH
jgi:hypothetical protein